MVIARDGDSLRIRYEEWDRERTIHMDGRWPSAVPRR